MVPASSLLLGWMACGGAAPRPTGTLVLVSEIDGKAAAWTMQADGSGAARLMQGVSFPAAADPRGTDALLVRVDEDDAQHLESLWLVSLTGANRPQRLTPDAAKVRNPAWAPDGSWIVFESDAASYRDLYRVNRNGAGLKRLTLAQHGSFEPAVSPDGRRIAFGTSRDGNAEIYVMTADGADPARFTHQPGDDVRPRWAPRGDLLAWIAHRDGIPRVMLTDGEGANTRPLRPRAGKASDLDLAWSPDARRLAVVVQRGDGIDIEIVEVDTGRVQRVGGAGTDEHPTWSPDGSWLAFTSAQPDGGSVVTLTTARGEHPTSLPSPAGASWLPRWLPAAP